VCSFVVYFAESGQWNYEKIAARCDFIFSSSVRDRCRNRFQRGTLNIHVEWCTSASASNATQRTAHVGTTLKTKERKTETKTLHHWQSICAMLAVLSLSACYLVDQEVHLVQEVLPDQADHEYLHSQWDTKLNQTNWSLIQFSLFLANINYNYDLLRVVS